MCCSVRVGERPSFSSSKAAARAFYTFEAFASAFFSPNIWHACGRVSGTTVPHDVIVATPLLCMYNEALVDLASCLPFVELGGGELPTLTWLAFRFRILKSERYTRAFSSVYRVVWYNSEILGVALFIGLLMMTTSTLLWYWLPSTMALTTMQMISLNSCNILPVNPHAHRSRNTDWCPALVHQSYRHADGSLFGANFRHSKLHANVGF